MRRESGQEVTAAAQRRLELLGRELALAGLHPGRSETEDPEPVLEPVAQPVLAPVLVPDPGRHAGNRRGSRTPEVVAWMQDRLPGPLQGRLALGPSHVVLVIGLVATVLAVVAWTTIKAAPASVPVPVAHTSRAPAASPAVRSVSDAATGAANGAATGAAGVSGNVVVDVAGKVRRPGIATLPTGSRVVDAIRRAGGAKRGVDLSSLNLARLLVDGEQILVGVAPVPGIAAAQPPGAAGGALVNLNAATLEQLDSLPGVGPVTAQKIMDWRTAHGAFSAIDELLEVDGIGEKTLADISPHVTL